MLNVPFLTKELKSFADVGGSIISFNGIGYSHHKIYGSRKAQTDLALYDGVGIAHIKWEYRYTTT